ncbi:MAG: hypothetical protein Q8L55_07125 [Phycisphaerales bacterium]|nr:hypothetical protein [Phycisphaerales bacterium]
MNTHEDTILYTRKGPAGRKSGRAIALAAAHAAAILLVTGAGVAAFCQTAGSGQRDLFPYGMEGGTLVAGGAIDKPLGMINSVTTARALRGLGGPIGTLLTGKTERTGPGELDDTALLAATRTLAASNREPHELHARAWARTGTIVLFEPGPNVWLSASATLALGAVAWGLLFATVGAGVRRLRSASKRRRAAAGVCEHCAYPRMGAGPCPECGRAAGQPVAADAARG